MFSEEDIQCIQEFIENPELDFDMLEKAARVIQKYSDTYSVPDHHFEGKGTPEVKLSEADAEIYKLYESHNNSQNDTAAVGGTGVSTERHTHDYKNRIPRPPAPTHEDPQHMFIPISSESNN